MEKATEEAGAQRWSASSRGNTLGKMVPQDTLSTSLRVDGGETLQCSSKSVKADCNLSGAFWREKAAGEGDNET